jgi:1,4-dihydroxy-2-naphthoate octaprenyltransferase
LWYYRFMTARQFFAIVEIRTKIVSLSTYLLATLYVLFRTGRPDWLNAALMLAATLLVDMGTTAFNTFFDYWKGVDRRESNMEGDKVLVHEAVPGAWALLIALACFALAAVPGLLLTWRVGWPLLGIGILSVSVGFFYSAGPFPISSTPVGELFAGGLLGPVLFLLVWYVHWGPPDTAALLVSLPSFPAIAAILTVNNTCDIEGDRRSGRRTLSIALGRKGGTILAVCEGMTAFAVLALLGFSGYLPGSAALTALPFALLSLLEFYRMSERGYSHSTKQANMGSISRVFLFFTAAEALILIQLSL